MKSNRYRSHFLSDKGIAYILAESKGAGYVIGGIVDLKNETIWVLLGDMSSRLVPFKWFEPNPTATPNFKDFEIADWGQSVRLGNWECSSRHFEGMKRPVKRVRRKVCGPEGCKECRPKGS